MLNDGQSRLNDTYLHTYLNASLIIWYQVTWTTYIHDYNDRFDKLIIFWFLCPYRSQLFRLRLRLIGAFFSWFVLVIGHLLFSFFFLLLSLSIGLEWTKNVFFKYVHRIERKFNWMWSRSKTFLNGPSPTSFSFIFVPSNTHYKFYNK